MNDTHEIQCVECGEFFSVEDADVVSVSASAVRCPECGRCNYCDIIEDDGIRVESFDADGGLEETDEPYMEGYLSDDLVYDGKNRLDASKYKKIGVAKRKREVPSQPLLEYRKVLAQNLPLDFGKGYRTNTAMEDFMLRELNWTEDKADQ